MAIANHRDFAFCVLMLDKSDTDQSIQRLAKQLENQARTEGYKDILVDRVSLEVPASTLMLDEPEKCIVLYVRPEHGVNVLKEMDRRIRLFPQYQVFTSAKATVNHTKDNIQTIKQLQKQCHLTSDTECKMSGYLFQLEYFNRLLAEALLSSRQNAHRSAATPVADVTDTSSDVSTGDDSGIASPESQPKKKRGQKQPPNFSDRPGDIETHSGSSTDNTNQGGKGSCKNEKLNQSTERAIGALDENRTSSATLAKDNANQRPKASLRKTHSGTEKTNDHITSNQSSRVDSQRSVQTNKTQVPSSGTGLNLSASPKTTTHVVKNSTSDTKEQYEKALVDAKKVPLPRSFSIGGDKTILIEAGNITKMKVDCVVSASNSKLLITSGVSKAIADAAGKSMYAFCKDYIKRKGQLSETRCVLSAGYNLPAKFIMHAVGPNWKNYKGREPDGYRALSLTIKYILRYADNNDVKSIAIPAISSGHFGGSGADVAESIVDTILNTAPVLVSLKEIHLVDLNTEMLYLYCVRLKNLQSPDINLVEIQASQNSMATKRRPTDMQRTSIDDSSLKGASPPVSGYDMNQLTQTVHNMKLSYITPHSSGIETIKTYQIFANQIFIVKGSIVDSKVDCIVNAASKRLELKGGVARAIAQAAGPKIYCWRDEVVKQHGNLNETECIVSSGFDLHCKYIIHALGPTWKDHKDREKCYDSLYKTVRNCLREARRKGCASIAIPAISSGQSGVPPEVVSAGMTEAICEFLELYTTVNEVHIIDMNADVLTHLMDSLDQRQNARRSRARDGTGSSGARRRRSSSIGNLSDLQNRSSFDAGSSDSTKQPVLTRPASPSTSSRPKSTALTGSVSSKSSTPKTGLLQGFNKAASALRNNLPSPFQGGARPKTSPASITSPRNGPVRASHEIYDSSNAANDDKRSRKYQAGDYSTSSITTRQRSNSVGNVRRKSYKRV